MRGFSKAIIAGNLTRDPEQRVTQNGAKVASFSVAVNRVYKNAAGENTEEVSYINCAAWGKLCDTIMTYAKKGSGVLVSGRLRQHSWDDQSGQKRSAVEIVVEDFNFVGGSNNGGDGGNRGGSNNAADAGADVIPDDIPAEGEEVDLKDIPF